MSAVVVEEAISNLAVEPFAGLTPIGGEMTP